MERHETCVRRQTTCRCTTTHWRRYCRNYAKQTSEIEFNPEEITTDKIIEIIDNLGYRAITI